jgi:hypothetical protein
MKWQVEMKGNAVMKCASAILVSGALACLAGCASPARYAVSEPIGLGPTVDAITSRGPELQVYTARIRASLYLNQEEFLWNNNFGKNDFLCKAAHTDYTIHSQSWTVFKHVKNAQNDEGPILRPMTRMT